MHAFLCAVGFLTRIPLPRSAVLVDEASLARSLVYFPLVGALIGLSTATFFFAFSSLWAAWIAVLLALAIELRLTGAMHEDGLADLADAFGGGWDREAVLRILKDSRLGTYGSLALFLGVGLRAAAMIEVSPAEFWIAMAFAGGVGRFSMLIVLYRMPPAAGRESLTGSFGGKLTPARLLLAGSPLLFVLLPALWLAPARALLGLVGLLALHLWATRSFQRKIGGVSGDALGSVAYLGQLIVLLAAAARI